MSADPAAIIAFCSVGAALAIAYLVHDRDRPIHPADDPDHAPHRDDYMVAVRCDCFGCRVAAARYTSRADGAAAVYDHIDAELAQIVKEGRA